MNRLTYLHEPDRLLLTWQQPDNLPPRTRRVVAEIVRDNDKIVFRYLPDTADYQAALANGFLGYPAFDPAIIVHETGVLEALSRRLPPRKRDDFAEYLVQYRLPENFNGSDLALLGYTGGRLPSDTFGFVPDFSQTVLPIDLLLEVAGHRHQESMGCFQPKEGMPITFQLDPENAFDADAVQVLHDNQCLGYVNRALHPWFANLLRNGRPIAAFIERVNGKPDRPLIYVMCRIG